MKGKLALEVDRGDCRGRVGDWVGLGVKGERTRKIESQSFGPEPFENFGTGFYFRSARLDAPRFIFKQILLIIGQKPY